MLVYSCEMDPRVKFLQKSEELLSADYYAAYNLSAEYVLGIVTDILQAVGVVSFLNRSPRSLLQIVKRFRFANQAIIPLGWMLNFAVENGLLSRLIKNDGVYYEKYILKDFSSRADIKRRILEFDNSFSISMELVDCVYENYQDFLLGNISGEKLLFSGSAKKSWPHYFDNKFSGYRIFNQMAAETIVDVIRKRKHVRILELGSGCGGAAVLLANILREGGLISRVTEYVFSDISPSFLLAAQRNSDMSVCGTKFVFQRLDFDLCFQKQGFIDKNFDIVFGVNSLHIARDVVATFCFVRKVLRDNGVFVISELVRSRDDSPLFQEFIFNLLKSYQTALTRMDVRTMPGFLSIHSWRKIFTLADFDNYRELTNVDLNKNSDVEFVATMVGENAA